MSESLKMALGLLIYLTGCGVVFAGLCIAFPPPTYTKKDDE